MKLAPYILSAAIGFALAFLFFKPEVVEIKIVEKETIDTTFNDVSDVIPFDSLLFESLHDSIDYYRSLYSAELEKEDIVIIKEGEQIQAPLRRYSGFKPTLYGNIGYSAVVIGSLREINLRQDLKLPTIHHRIEREITRTRDLRGLYAGASVSSDIDYKIGASYVDRDWQFNYDYQPREKIHWVGVRKRLF